MKSINEILAINFNARYFARKAENCISKETTNKLEYNIKKLDRIVSNYNMQPPLLQNSLEIYNQFMNSAREGWETISKDFNNARDVKKLCSILSYEPNNQKSILESSYFQFALRLVYSFYKNTMFNQLFYQVLDNWGIHNATRLQIFLWGKIKNYTGSITFIQNAKKYNKFYFTQKGPQNLALSMLQHNIDIDELDKKLVLAEYYKHTKYFQLVFVHYCEIVCKNHQLQNEFISLLNHLQHFCCDWIIKKSLSILIEHIEQENLISLREDIEKLAFESIGDPGIESYWSPWDGATEAEKQKLEQARKILNSWLTQKFIELFFEKITIDYDRKKFWLRYVKKISNFKIYTNRNTLNDLKKDKRLAPLLKARTGVLTSAQADVSALVMGMNNYILIEFSRESHAFYAYKKSNPKCPDLTKESYDIYLLRHPSNRDMLYRKSYDQVYDPMAEGRVFHTGFWQSHLDKWIYSYVEKKRK